MRGLLPEEMFRPIVDCLLCKLQWHDLVMVQPTRTSLPEADYLTRIGQIAYEVSSIEWCVLGDLATLEKAIPASLNVGALAGKTTGAIAKSLRDAVPAISLVAVRDYIDAAATALDDVSGRRNDVLHARPAAVDGRQRLYRWRLSPGDQFPISVEWLDEQIAAVVAAGDAMYNLREPAHVAVARLP